MFDACKVLHKTRSRQQYPNRCAPFVGKPFEVVIAFTQLHAANLVSNTEGRSKLGSTSRPLQSRLLGGYQSIQTLRYTKGRFRNSDMFLAHRMWCAGAFTIGRRLLRSSVRLVVAEAEGNLLHPERVRFRHVSNQNILIHKGYFLEMSMLQTFPNLVPFQIILVE